MNSIDLKSILNFSAFRPEPDDPSASWKKRFPAERTVFFGLGRGVLTWRAISRSGKPEDLESVRAEPKEVLAQTGDHIKPLTERGWCAVSLNTRYVISLETNLSRRAGSEELLKTNARGVLGGRYERGKRYALTHNPETNSSILLTFDEDQTRKTESLFTEAGFRVGRICCGAYVLLKHALKLINLEKGSENPVSTFYIVCCEGAVCALVQDQDRWLELRSRTDVYEEDLTPITDLLAPFHSRLAPHIGITLICDEPLEGLVDRLTKVFPNREVADLSQPALLATLMVQN
ncbi:MAG: hypothetical protein IAE94_15600 [Chthoniobacterales bacterium]|nr:hypothetical protein [Chthoniobacterales bacterium]